MCVSGKEGRGQLACVWLCERVRLHVCVCLHSAQMQLPGAHCFPLRLSLAAPPLRASAERTSPSTAFQHHRPDLQLRGEGSDASSPLPTPTMAGPQQPGGAQRQLQVPLQMQPSVQPEIQVRNPPCHQTPGSRDIPRQRIGHVNVCTPTLPVTSLHAALPGAAFACSWDSSHALVRTASHFTHNIARPPLQRVECF